MKKKIAGIILASVLTFSAMAGVQASAEDRLWENSMEADGVEDDISQNQTEMKDGDDSTSVLGITNAATTSGSTASTSSAMPM